MTTGQRALVSDAEDRVRGRVPFVLDEQTPGMLHGRIVRSTVAHGVLRAVDCSAALRLPGVVAIVTGADVPGAPDHPAMFGMVVRDIPVLAVDRVRYVGEPIAAIAAIDPDVADEAADLVEVTIDPLPAVLSIDEALAEDAPILHPAGPNLLAEQSLVRGDVAQAFQSAHLVVEESLFTPPVQGVPLETHVVLAEASRDQICVHTTSQSPFLVRRELAAVFSLPPEQVRVIVRNLGGGFGSKVAPRIEPIAVLLARKAGRPVKIVLSRAEEFVTVQRHATLTRFATGVSRDGRILAMRAETTFRGGAYADNTSRLMRHALYSLPGPYRIEHLDIRVRGVRTNAPPCGPLRAPGTAQVQWAREAHLEGIAATLGIDPLEFRHRNLVTSRDRFVLGGPMGPVHLGPLLDDVRLPGPSDVDPARPWRRVGTGYGAVLKTTQTPTTSEAEVAVDDGDRVTVLTSTVEMGQGARTALGQLAASSLGATLAQTSVTTPDTAFTPPDQGTMSSRSTFSMGTAVMAAAGHVRDRLLDLGERALEVDRRDLTVTEGRVAPIGTPSAGRTFGELIRDAGLREIRERSSFTNQPMLDEATGEVGVSTHHHQAAAAARVAVDLETGAVTVLEVRMATHAGVVVNPTLAELQGGGNAAFGVGQAMMEEIVSDGGQMQNASLADYLIPSILDLPAGIRVTFTEDESREIHGIGETALPAIVAAITNAISDAIKARIHEIPATPERVFAAHRDAQRTPDRDPGFPQ